MLTHFSTLPQEEGDSVYLFHEFKGWGQGREQEKGILMILKYNKKLDTEGGGVLLISHGELRFKPAL